MVRWKAGTDAGSVWRHAARAIRLLGAMRFADLLAVRRILRSGLFDRDWYVAENPQAAADLHPLLHYLRQGAAAGRKPHPLFASAWYLAENPDVAASNENPLAHYLRCGAAEGRDPDPLFDSDWYLASNPGVAAAGLNPLVHYVRWGARERRAPCARFDVDYYLSQLPPLERDVNPLVHFYTCSRRGEGEPAINSEDAREGLKFRAAIVESCANGRPTLLMVLHAAGGGVERHVRDLLAICRGQVNVLLLQPRSKTLVACRQPDLDLAVDFSLPAEWRDLLRFLRDCHVARLHVHHLLGNESCLRMLVSELGVPFDVTAHDHYLLSPQPHLVDRHGRFVGEDLSAAENELLLGSIAPARPASVAQWQERHGWIAREAARFIVPSHDTLRRFQRYFAGLAGVVAAHPAGGDMPSVTTCFAPGASLRIAVLGEVYGHKGLAVLASCAELVRHDHAPLEFVVLGSPDPAWNERLANLGVRISGRYEIGDLPRLVSEYAPHLLWYPAQCPETFSYTLSEGLQLGLPLVVADLGAFPERVGGRPWTWIMPWDTPPRSWIAFFTEIRERHFSPGLPPQPVGVPWAVTDRFYRHEYLSWSGAAERRQAGSETPQP